MAPVEVTVSSERVFMNLMILSQEFESLLKDVVNAKRLSASKISSLTDLVVKNVEVRPMACILHNR